MPDLEREGPPRELQVLRRHRDSRTMLAIIMSGLAALFIVAIVAAYNYSTNPSVAEHPSPAATAGSTVTTTGTRAPAAPAETTGSGSAERGAPMQPRTPQ